MKKIEYSDKWPESWKTSYFYDKQELYGDVVNWGYCYGYWNRRRYILDAAQQYLGKGESILDIGGAQGNFSLLLAEEGYGVTWNDYREELVEYIKMKYEKGVINYLPGNIFELEGIKKFDAVLLTEVIEHVAHPDELLKNLSSLVREKGYIILTTPNGEFFSNKLPKFSDCEDPAVFENEQFKPNSDGHIFLLHFDEIKELAKDSGFSVIEHKYFNNPMTIGQFRTWHALPLIPRFFVDWVEKKTSSLKSIKIKKKLNSQMLAVLQKTE